MSALLAGRMTGAYRLDWPKLENAFRWLEQQKPPVVIAPRVIRSEKPYRIAVPNNDLDVAANAWFQGKSYEMAKLKALKTIQPFELPACSPRVHYLWLIEGPIAADSTLAAHVAGVRQLAHSLHTLGWGVDMAFADAQVVSEDAAAALAGERFQPGDSGDLFEVPIEGFLEDQLSTYERFTQRVSAGSVNPSVRPMVYGLQHYRKEGDGGNRDWAVFHLQDVSDALRRKAVPWHKASLVHSWIRHAAAVALRGEKDWPEERIASYVQGHNEADRTNWLSYLPLPTIGMAHTDGMIRRVAIVEPLGKKTDVLALLRRKLNGVELTNENGERECVLSLVPLQGETDGVSRCYRPREGRRVWESVTPVILHGYNSNKGKLSLAKTEKLLLQAFEQAGYPARLIESFVFQPAPLWQGVGGAVQMKVPAQLNNYPRYHVRVEFKEAIGGPVLAGIGRHCGIGLFAAARD